MTGTRRLVTSCAKVSEGRNPRPMDSGSGPAPYSDTGAGMTEVGDLGRRARGFSSSGPVPIIIRTGAYHHQDRCLSSSGPVPIIIRTGAYHHQDRCLSSSGPVPIIIRTGAYHHQDRCLSSSGPVPIIIRTGAYHHSPTPRHSPMQPVAPAKAGVHIGISPRSRTPADCGLPTA